MKCTACNEGLLAPSFLEDMPRAHTCLSCGGLWILIENYVRWIESKPGIEAEEVDESEVVDTKSALLCPMSGAIMQKIRISHKSERRIDYSPSVGGVWLDKGEWEILKQEGLAGSLNKILTAHWQKSIREDSARAMFTELYQSRFGEETYEKLKEVREWLNANDQKSDIRAYLLAADPYSVEK